MLDNLDFIFKNFLYVGELLGGSYKRITLVGLLVSAQRPSSVLLLTKIYGIYFSSH